MNVKKIEYIPVGQMSAEEKKKYNIKEGDKFAQVTVSNPDPQKGLNVKGVKSAVNEVKKAFKKKELENFEI